MRRRLDLAAALVTHPPILLLDEPTTGLDPASRQDLWDVIGSLVADGTTVLLTTQYLEEADRLADRIVVIDHGAVAAEGTSTELKARIGGISAVLSLTDATAAAEVVALLGDLHAVVGSDDSTVVVPARDGASTVRDVLNRVDARGIGVVRLDMHEPTLDEVFLALTGSRS
jgi:ABC-2 type transport system ATP-binding protein